REGPAGQMMAFIQPLLDRADGSEEKTRRAISLGSAFWNLAVLDTDAMREDGLVQMEQAFPEDARADFRATAAIMIERHRRMFPEIHARVRERRNVGAGPGE